MEKNTIRHFRKIMRQFDREMFFQNSSSCCNGISMAQCHVLLEIESKNDISVTELSNNLMLNKSTISRTVDGLVNIGLVDRQIPKDNRRTTTLNLTGNGIKSCANINWNSDNFVENWLSVLSEKEQKEFLTIMGKVTSHMATFRDNYDDEKSCC